MKNALHYGYLHIAILSWGASGIMVNLTNVSSAGLVFYRSIIACVFLALVHLVMRQSQKVAPKDRNFMLATGLVLGVHWLCFFSAIQYSTVSIGLICISATPVFVAFIQPLVSKVRIKKSQIVLGAISVFAISLIYKFETEYRFAIFIGLCAAFLDAIYTVMTDKTNNDIKSPLVTQYQTLAAAAFVLVVYSFIETDYSWMALTSVSDIAGVIFLGIVCSAISMTLYIIAIKKLSTFTASLSLNLEAVYGILLALVIFGEREVMSAQLYFGGALLISCVVIDGILNNRSNKKQIA